MKAMEPYVDKTYREVADAWEEVAASMGWDRCDSRLRLDNLKEKHVGDSENV